MNCLENDFQMNFPTDSSSHQRNFPVGISTACKCRRNERLIPPVKTGKKKLLFQIYQREHAASRFFVRTGKSISQRPGEKKTPRITREQDCGQWGNLLLEDAGVLPAPRRLSSRYFPNDRTFARQNGTGQRTNCGKRRPEGFVSDAKCRSHWIARRDKGNEPRTTGWRTMSRSLEIERRFSTGISAYDTFVFFFSLLLSRWMKVRMHLNSWRELIRRIVWVEPPLWILAGS